jgi:hypothetical protein
MFFADMYFYFNPHISNQNNRAFGQVVKRAMSDPTACLLFEREKFAPQLHGVCFGGR